MKILVLNKNLPPMGLIQIEEKKLISNETDIVIWAWDRENFLNQLKTYDFDLIIHGGDLILPSDSQKLFNLFQK